MNLEFSPELAALLVRDQSQAMVGKWILENTATGKHLNTMLEDWKNKVLNPQEKAVIFNDLRTIGSILPVLLKLRLLP